MSSIQSAPGSSAMGSSGTITAQRRFRLNDSNAFDVTKADYIYCLRLLLQAFQRVPVFHCKHRYKEQLDCTFSIPNSLERKVCAAERSLQDHILRESGIIHRETGYLPEKDGYLVELARAWYEQDIDPLWVFMWEFVSKIALPLATKELHLELARERARKQVHQSQRDFETGGVRKMLLRYQFLNEQRRLKESRQPYLYHGFAPPKISERYLSPQITPFFQPMCRRFSGPSSLKTVERVDADQRHLVGKDREQILRYERVMRMIKT